MSPINYLKICHWNANGISQHKLELQHFLAKHEIDLMLVSETHLTDKHNFRINGYEVYDTKHPLGRSRGGTAIIIKNRICHYVLNEYSTEEIQATSVCVDLDKESLVIASIYCPPNNYISADIYKTFFAALGQRFIVAGDFNAKHTYWGSRLTTPRGRQLMNVIQENHYDVASCGHPTYWPTDRRKIPDILDFAVTGKINREMIEAKPLSELSSDHSPVLLHYWADQKPYPTINFLTNTFTNWLKFKMYISSHIDLTSTLETAKDINMAMENFNQLLINAAISASPKQNSKHTRHTITSAEIEKLLTEKRRLRRIWQTNRSPDAKYNFNQAKNKLQSLLQKNKMDYLQNYLKQLSSHSDTNYSLWKATKYLKRPQQPYPPIRLPNGDWARSDEEKAKAFADHLEGVFTPNPGLSVVQTDVAIQPERKFKIKKPLVKFIITHQTQLKKAPGYDQITGEMLKKLPECAFGRLAQIFNSIYELGCIPECWKLSSIRMIPKPGKDPTKVSSYRPISLLPIISKVFENAIIEKIKPKLRNIIPNHQFGFRAEHGTTEQVHRVATEIRSAHEEKKYCSAVFLDVAQAFDKVWHEGLLYKINIKLPEIYQLMKSYLSNRRYYVKHNTSKSVEKNVLAGVPQGSVLGPTLYLIFTFDLPTSSQIMTSTFADDTAIVCTHKNPQTASETLQRHINDIEIWLKKWRIKVNEEKSTHVTFTLNKLTCPPVTMNGIQIPQANEAKYLGVHLDRRLTWRKHIEMKRGHIKLKVDKMHWLMGKYSTLDLEYKLLLYNTVIKPIWSYGCQLWQSTSNSNIDIIQRIQSKILRMITGAPWFVKNKNIHKDLSILTVKDELLKMRINYAGKLSSHPNMLARNLKDIPLSSRLKKKTMAVTS